MNITVAVCTYRRFDVLRACIDHLLRQTLDSSRFKILVIDNSVSPEQSRAFRDSLPKAGHQEYIITERAGLSYARNLAMQRCDTEILAYTDDDTEAHPDWLEELLATFERHGERAGVVGGRVDPIWDQPRPAWLPDELLGALTVVDWGPKEFVIDNCCHNFLVGANIAYRTDLIRQLGGFSEEMGRKGSDLMCHEELELNIRVQRAGFEVVYAPRAVLRHHVHANRLLQETLCNLSFCEGQSRAILQARGLLPASDLRRLVGFWTQPEKVGALSLFTDSSDPATVLKKVCKASELGLLLRHAASAAPNAAPALPLAFRAEPLTPKVAAKPTHRENAAAGDTIYLATPTRNCEDQIDQMFRSVLSQGGEFRIRWHVQDGASTDGTVAMLEEWDRAIKKGRVDVACRGVEFTFASEPDGGMYEAIARAFDRLQVPDHAWMTWLNADDRFAAGAFATVQAAGLSYPEIQWLTGVTCILEPNDILRPVLDPIAFPREVLRAGLCDLERWQCPQQEGTFWRGGLYRKAGGLNRTLKLAGDYDLWIRLAEHEELYSFHGVLAYFRIREGQLSGDLAAYKAEAEDVRPASARDLAWKDLSEKILQRKLLFNLLKKAGDDSGFRVDRFTNLLGYLPGQVLKNDPDLQNNLLAARVRELAEQLKVNLDNGSKAPPAPGISPPTPAKAQSSQPAAATFVPQPAPPPTAPSVAPVHTVSARDQKTGRIARLLRNLKWYWILSRSGLFYESYYLAHSPDVAAAGTNPLYHYLACGGLEGRNPNPLFDSAYYYATNPDVAATGVNPLVHYVLYGAREGRDPSAHFSTKAYLAKKGGLQAVGGNPLRHYLEVGVLAPDEPAPLVPAPKPLAAAPALAPKPLAVVRTPAPKPQTAAPAPQAVAPVPAPKPPVAVPALEPLTAPPAPALSMANTWFPDNFTYAKKSHLEKMRPAAMRLLGRKPTPENCQLKQYQDMIVVSFIHDRIPAGSRILDVGGGNSRVLKLLADTYECWNVDKFEGMGNGPKDLKAGEFRLVRAYMGDFTPELPDNYFDFVFSISALEHTPAGKPERYEDIFRDIQRVSRNGAWSLHLFDVVAKNGGIWFCDCLKAFFTLACPENALPVQMAMLNDPDLYLLSEDVYESLWRPLTKKSYKEFGQPSNVTVLWQVKKPPAAATAPVPKRPAAASAFAPSKANTCFPDDYVYAKTSHFKKMRAAALETYGHELVPEKCGLKQYQDLLVLAFIHDRIPPGSRILDVGGGNARVLNLISSTYECWNIDKLEGLGYGPKEIKSEGYHLVRAYMGDFSPELPDNYFDFVFSISALEHTPDNQPETYQRIFRDIERVARNGSWSLHLFDVILAPPRNWMSSCMKAFFRLSNASHLLPSAEQLLNDPELFCISRERYYLEQKRFTNKSYEETGRPSNVSVLWTVRKQS